MASPGSKALAGALRIRGFLRGAGPEEEFEQALGVTGGGAALYGATGLRNLQFVARGMAL